MTFRSGTIYADRSMLIAYGTFWLTLVEEIAKFAQNCPRQPTRALSPLDDTEWSESGNLESQASSVDSIHNLGYVLVSLRHFLF